MPNITKKIVSDFSIVISFSEVSDIRLRGADAEKALRKIFKQQVSVNNIPDNDDPRIPRLLFSMQNMKAGISKVSARLDFLIGSKTSLEEACEKLKNDTLRFYNAISKMIGSNNLKDTGIIVSVGYISNDTEQDAIKYFKNRFMNVEMEGDPTTFQLQVGSNLGDGYYLHYTPSYFVLRGKNLKGLNGNKIKVDLNSMDILETGYELRVDINNKPSFVNGTSFDKSTEKLLEKVIFYIHNKADNFIGLSPS